MRWFWQKKKDNPGQDSGSVAHLSYQQRVDEFWKWWQSNSERILDSVDEDGGASIQPEISERVNQLHPPGGFGWVFGPGEGDARHSFTITPEGSELKKYFVDYWFSKRPTLPEWSFYPSRQPSNRESPFAISMQGVEVSSESLWISPTIDADNKEIDITAWSPTFAEIDQDSAWTFLFLHLDDALGEAKVSRCIGAIDMADDKLENAMPASELVEFVNTTFEENDWSLDGAIGKVYQYEEYRGDFPRGDIYVGSTEAYSLVKEYGDEPFEHASAQSGGEFAFIQFPASLLPEEAPVEFRGEIEDAIDAALEAENLGKTVGGAMGHNAFYIDYVSFDRDKVRSIIMSLLEARDLSHQILPFTK